MAKEIERKYLVTSLEAIKDAIAVYHIEQAYLSVRPVVRLRIRDEEAFITIKGKSAPGGISRDEWEYALPPSDAREMMSMALGQRLIKERYLVPYEGHTWELDVFRGAYEGLCLAEIELSDEAETFALPPWVGDEVTGQVAYHNATLALAKTKS